MRLFETIHDLHSGADVVRRRRYGVVEALGGRVVAVHFRPFPKWASLADVLPWTTGWRRQGTEDRCRLYFNQPRGYANFLAVPYIISSHATQLATMHAALEALDEIARIKQSDALLADVLSSRISDRLLARRGWTSHKPSRWHRHYIKRFYGEYPPAQRTGEPAVLAAVGDDLAYSR